MENLFTEYALTLTVKKLHCSVHHINVFSVMRDIRIAEVFSFKNLPEKFRRKLLGHLVSSMIEWGRSRLTLLIEFKNQRGSTCMHFLLKNLPQSLKDHITIWWIASTGVKMLRRSLEKKQVNFSKDCLKLNWKKVVDNLNYWKLSRGKATG